jgi:two-component system cell cycle response regulator CpdR
MPKILIAEDHHLTRMTMGQFLRGQGYTVELAENGGQAISLLKDNVFDLIISDIVMPRVNGWELAEHVARNAPDTHVLLMTAYPQVQPRPAQLHKTPEVILKPVVLADVASKIEQILGLEKQ